MKQYNITFKTEHFQFFYNESNRKFAEELSSLIENAYLNAGKEFHINIPIDVYDFYICDCVDDYIHYTNKTKETYQEWMVGWADKKLKRLCLLVTDAPEQNTPEYHSYLTGVMIHEVAHIVFDSLTDEPDNVECWLTEGIAIATAKQTDTQYISEDDYPLIRDIAGKGDCDAFYDNGGYDYAGIYVSFFIRKFGKDTFIQAYKNEVDVYTYLYDGFEAEAIHNYLMNSSATI